MKDLNYNNIPLLNEKEKKERGIIGKALDVAIPVGAGMLAYKAMGSKPTPTSIGAASNARAATGGTGAPAPTTGAKPWKIGDPLDQGLGVQGKAPKRDMVKWNSSDNTYTINGKALTPAQKQQYLNKSGDFEYSKFNKEYDARYAEFDKARQDRTKTIGDRRRRSFLDSERRYKFGAYEEPPKAPKAIAPTEPTPRLKPAPSPTTLQKPDPTFKRTDSGVQSTLRDPNAYRDPTKDPKGYNKGPTGDRARRKEAANRTPEISIKGKPQKPPFGPQQMKNTPLRTGPPFKPQPRDYTPGKVGYEKTKYSPEQLKKQALVKNAQKHAKQATVAGFSAATLPFGGAAAKGVTRVIKAAVPYAQKAYNAVRQGSTKLVNKPIPPLQAVADRTGKIGQALLPTTPKSVAGQAAAGTVIDKALNAKSQKSKVKKTYRQHVQGIRN